MGPGFDTQIDIMMNDIITMLLTVTIPCTRGDQKVR